MATSSPFQSWHLHIKTVATPFFWQEDLKTSTPFFTLPLKLSHNYSNTLLGINQQVTDKKKFRRRKKSEKRQNYPCDTTGATDQLLNNLLTTFSHLLKSRVHHSLIGCLVLLDSNKDALVTTPKTLKDSWKKWLVMFVHFFGEKDWKSWKSFCWDT